MRKLYLGDIHGNFQILDNFRRTLPDVDEIIVVGDFGYGFPSSRGEKYYNYSLLERLASDMDSPRIRFIRGNHDNFKAIQEDFPMGSISFIPDGTVEGDTLYIGGAWSIDGVTGVWRNSRVEGIDWWADEEISAESWSRILDEVRGNEEITIVVSHDFPSSVFHKILPNSHNYRTYTQNKLEELRSLLPNVSLWIGGHYHVSRCFTDEDTTFIVLDCDGRGHVQVE